MCHDYLCALSFFCFLQISIMHRNLYLDAGRTFDTFFYNTMSTHVSMSYGSALIGIWDRERVTFV